MKAPAFDYVRADSVPEALALLRRHGDEAKIVAGGQSLLPALNLRLLAPKMLIDIGGIEALRGVEVCDGVVRVGAMARHAELMRSPDIARHVPLVAQALPHLSHPAIRNRGTLGGNLANADPASELPACCLALGATLIAAGPQGERRIAAGDFFTGIYETSLEPDELLVAAEFPVAPADGVHAFEELARRTGDYAIVGLAASGRAQGGALADLRLAFFSAGPKPVLAENAAAALQGRPVTEAAIADAQAALAQDLDPPTDLQASAGTRLHLARVLLRRAVDQLLPGAIEARMSA